MWEQQGSCICMAFTINQTERQSAATGTCDFFFFFFWISISGKWSRWTQKIDTWPKICFKCLQGVRNAVCYSQCGNRRHFSHLPDSTCHAAVNPTHLMPPALWKEKPSNCLLQTAPILITSTLKKYLKGLAGIQNLWQAVTETHLRLCKIVGMYHLCGSEIKTTLNYFFWHWLSCLLFLRHTGTTGLQPCMLTLMTPSAEQWHLQTKVTF